MTATALPESTIVDLNKKAVIMSAIDFRPLSFAKCEGFQMLAQALVDIGAKHGTVDIKTCFKDPTTYSRSVLPNLAAEVRQSIATALQAQFSSLPSNLSPASFVADHWTDKYRQIEFTSIGVIFVDQNFNIQAYDLCVREYEAQTKHSYNIHNDIMNKLEVYVDKSVLQKLEGKFVFVSDSDPKLVAALRDDFERQSCAIHDLSLCVKAALKCSEANSIGIMISDSKILVRHFKKTGLNRTLSKTLKQDVSTRFNSVYIMLQSLDDVFEEVNSQLTATDDIKYIANIKRKMLKSVCKELQRFHFATQKLAVEKTETLHLVVPVFEELKNKMIKQAAKYASDGDPDMSKLCNDLIKFTDEKCLAKLTWYHFAAVVLYPEFRSHPSVEAMEADIDRARLDLRAMVMQNQMNDNDLQQEKGKIKPKAILFDSDSESETDDQASRDDMPDENENEFDRYIRMSFDCDNLSPLQFWKGQANRFPRLSQIARSVFAIPASQNQTERSFSAAGHVMTDLRTTLDPEHLDELLLIRSHYKKTHCHLSAINLCDLHAECTVGR